MPARRTFRHLGLLGTVLEVQVVVADDAAAEQADALVVEEVARLQALLSARDATSALGRWARGEAEAPSELEEVLGAAERWRQVTGGAFDAAAGALFARWSEAEAAGVVPTDAELAEATASLTDPAARRRWCDPTAVAKGWIVDRAMAVAMAVDGVTSAVVNAGGDLRHAGAGSVVVGIEDPARPHDNAPPLDRVALAGAALATSGGARRWWTVGERRYPQVLDPRTGRPVDRVAAASVVAPDAAAADALATALVVLGAHDGLALVEGLDGVEALVIGADAAAAASPGWADLRPG